MINKDELQKALDILEEAMEDMTDEEYDEFLNEVVHPLENYVYAD